MTSDLAVLAGACVAAFLIGGWEWMMPALVLFRRIRLSVALAGLGWMVAYRVTGDRRLYFCYTILYAVYLASSLKNQLQAFLGAGLIVAIFLGVRGEFQQASGSVLMVELVTAVVILAVCVGLIQNRLVAAIAGSVMALVSLAI